MSVGFSGYPCLPYGSPQGYMNYPLPTLPCYPYYVGTEGLGTTPELVTPTGLGYGSHDFDFSFYQPCQWAKTSLTTTDPGPPNLTGEFGPPLCGYVGKETKQPPPYRDTESVKSHVAVVHPPSGKERGGDRPVGVNPFSGASSGPPHGGRHKRSLRKRRNNERRKEKSRDAARCRRGKESEIFAELGALLPLEAPLSATLDKASVIRVAIAFLRTRSVCRWGLGITPTAGARRGSDELLRYLAPPEDRASSGKGVLAALDGFLIVLTKEGDIVYTSENISTFLGLQQMDVVGHSLLDYTHPCDHDEARRLPTIVGSGRGSAFLRFKCTLTAKGRSVNLKSASYKVVQVTGQVLSCSPLQRSVSVADDNTPSSTVVSWEEEEEGVPSRGGGAWVVALGVPVPHPSNIEVPLDKQTFVSKHSLDMKFTFVDDNVKSFCGYRPDDLLGRSLFQVNHALDTHVVKEAYKTLRSKGQVETGRYRFLARGGGYVWVVTQATLITGHRDTKPQYVVCLNYVLSHTESPDVIFSDCQLEETTTTTSPNSPVTSLSCSPAVVLPAPVTSIVHLPLSIPQPPSLTSSPTTVTSSVPHSYPPTPAYSQPSPVAATYSLLRDRTEDMNEGYLTFADNYSQVTVLKDDPEDLTHLAPSVGEGCVPLEVPIFLPGFDDFLVEANAPEFELPKLAPLQPTQAKQQHQTTSQQQKEEEFLNNLLFLRDPSSGPQSSAPATGQPKNGGPITTGVYRKQNTQTATAQLPQKGRPKQKSLEDLLLQDFRFSPKAKKSNLCHKVPVQGVTSPASGRGSPGNRFDSPEPLLSQASSPQTSSKSLTGRLNGSHPTPATSRLFSSLEGNISPDSTMDLLNSLELKLEAPYIPPIDEMLVFDQDDLFGLSSSNEQQDVKGEESYLGMKHKYGDLSSHNSTSPNLGSTSPQHPFQQAKMGHDTGGNVVDPNQVLPGQFYIKGEEKDNLQELRFLLEAPPPSPVKDPVDTPPPLRGSISPLSMFSDKGSLKRGSSPALPTPTKRLRTSLCVATTPPNPPNRRELGGGRSWGNSTPSRDLPTPNTPLMQQLLVSKEPICVRGRILSSAPSASSDGGRGNKCAAPSNSNAHTHSVLRNLLVSGRDERAGYTVLVSSLSQDGDGGLGVEGNKNNEEASLSTDGSLSPLHSFPLNKEGKVELTRQQLTALLDRAGVLRPSFRATPPTPPEEVPSPSSMFLPETPSTTPPAIFEAFEGDDYGRGSMHPTKSQQPLQFQQQQQQSSLFVVDSVPTLFDLAFDCDESPTGVGEGDSDSSPFFHGSELLMALEQSSQQHHQ